MVFSGTLGAWALVPVRSPSDSKGGLEPCRGTLGASKFRGLQGPMNIAANINGRGLWGTVRFRRGLWRIMRYGCTRHQAMTLEVVELLGYSGPVGLQGRPGRDDVQAEAADKRGRQT